MVFTLHLSKTFGRKCIRGKHHLTLSFHFLQGPACHVSSVSPWMTRDALMAEVSPRSVRAPMPTRPTALSQWEPLCLERVRNHILYSWILLACGMGSLLPYFYISQIKLLVLSFYIFNFLGLYHFFAWSIQPISMFSQSTKLNFSVVMV